MSFTLHEGSINLYFYYEKFSVLILYKGYPK